MRIWKSGSGWHHKHSSCFPSGCACQHLLYQEGLWLLSLTFKSLSLTSVCTNLGFYFTVGIETGINLRYNIRSERPACICGPQLLDGVSKLSENMHSDSLFYSEYHKYTSQNCVLNVFIYFPQGNWCPLLVRCGFAKIIHQGKSRVGAVRTGWKMLCHLIFSHLQTKTAFSFNNEYLLIYNLTSAWLLLSK